MSTQYLFRVMQFVGEFGELHTDGLTSDDADELYNRLRRLFPDDSFYVESYIPEETEERHYNENAVDGWEDMFPDY